VQGPLVIVLRAPAVGLLLRVRVLVLVLVLGDAAGDAAVVVDVEEDVGEVEEGVAVGARVTWWMMHMFALVVIMKLPHIYWCQCQK